MRIEAIPLFLFQEPQSGEIEILPIDAVPRTRVTRITGLILYGRTAMIINAGHRRAR